ncbi:MAG: hypothetical protein JWO70_2163 [Betaproteobacteria bacterium]|nr:hypothetical protein [Betaproteobacteria bacterium]
MLSCGSNVDRDGLRFGLVVLETFGEHPQGKDLGFCHRLVRSRPLRQDPRQFRHLSQPSAILFALVLDREIHVQPPKARASCYSGGKPAVKVGTRQCPQCHEHAIERRSAL